MTDPMTDKGAGRKRKLKVWGGNAGGTTRWIVATATKAEAAKIAGVSMHEFNNYWCDTGNDHELAVAMAKPGVVFSSPLDRDEFVEGALRYSRDRPWPPE